MIMKSTQINSQNCTYPAGISSTTRTWTAEKQHKPTAEQMFWYTADLIKCHILATKGISVHFNPARNSTHKQLKVLRYSFN